MNKKLLILDSNSILHRAFHALPPLTTKKGELVNAIYGFLLLLFKLVRELQPDYIAACFDFPAPTFRHKKFPEYKAKRPPTPKEFYQQIPKAKEVLGSLSIPFFEKEGFEADDIIASLKVKSQKSKVKSIIVSGDSDLLQLVDEQTEVYILKKGVKETVLYDENLVKKKYQGLSPEQLVDFKALIGDPSDNIPGVKGIGKKTAVKLLNKYGSIKNLYDKIEEEKNMRLKEILIRERERVFFSKDLVRLNESIPIEFDLRKCQFWNFNEKELEEIFKKYEFYSLLKRIPEITPEIKKTKKLF